MSSPTPLQIYRNLSMAHWAMKDTEKVLEKPYAEGIKAHEKFKDQVPVMRGAFDAARASLGKAIVEGNLEEKKLSIVKDLASILTKIINLTDKFSGIYSRNDVVPGALMRSLPYLPEKSQYALNHFLQSTESAEVSKLLSETMGFELSTELVEDIKESIDCHISTDLRELHEMQKEHAFFMMKVLLKEAFDNLGRYLARPRETANLDDIFNNGILRDEDAMYLWTLFSMMSDEAISRDLDYGKLATYIPELREYIDLVVSRGSVNPEVTYEDEEEKSQAVSRLVVESTKFTNSAKPVVQGGLPSETYDESSVNKVIIDNDNGQAVGE